MVPRPSLGRPVDGPIVMNTQEEVQQTIKEIRAGRFPPKRVAWDYKRLASFPSE